MRHLRILFLFLFSFTVVLSQEQRQIDSVKALIPKLNSDTAIIRNYLVLAEWIGVTEEWFSYNNKALDLVEKKLSGSPSKEERKILLTFKASGLNNTGYYYRVKNDYQKALEYYDKSKQMYVEVGNEEGEATCLTNIGAVETALGKAAEGIDKYSKALKIFKKVNDEKNAAIVLNNIGNQYLNQGNTKLALDYFNEALALHRKNGNLNGEVTVYANFGTLYHGLKEYQTAFNFYYKAHEIYLKMNDRHEIAKSYTNLGVIMALIDKKKGLYYDSIALALYTELNDEAGIGRALNNIGTTLSTMGEMEKAHQLLKRAYALRKKMNDLEGMANSAGNLAETFFYMKQPDSAVYYAEVEYKLAKQLGYLRNKRDAVQTLYKIHKKLKNYESALLYHEEFKHFNDSIVNKESNSLAARQLARIEFEKREVELKAEQEKKDLQAEEEKRKQRIVIISVSIVLVLVLILVVIIFRSLRANQRNNKIILDQKAIVEEKQKEIIDSINYARRIQEAALPEKEIKQKLFPESFVLFQPRDIVSGDFYWFTEKNGKRLIAAVDCTGHGVPGAFMSLIGNTFLNEIVNVKGITNPADILNELRERIIHSLKQCGGENKDGMDISILSFSGNKVEYAGANNPLWLVRGTECIEYKADKQPVGYYFGVRKPFTNHTIDLQKGDSCYIFTDGFADQFGGDKGKKFKYKTLKELLIEINTLSMPQQESILTERFASWKGNLEQVDDVCVIGIRY